MKCVSTETYNTIFQLCIVCNVYLLYYIHTRFEKTIKYTCSLKYVETLKGNRTDILNVTWHSRSMQLQVHEGTSINDVHK